MFYNKVRKSILIYFVFFYHVIFCSYAYSFSEIEEKSIQKTLNYFLSIKTIKGEFVQNDINGHKIRGEFYMARPSKFYFKYSDPPYKYIISDGSNIALYNGKLENWSVYSLSSTAFSIIFSEKWDDLYKGIQGIETNDSFVTIVFGKSQTENLVSLTFSKPLYRLVNWKIFDDSGGDTSVEILKYKKNVVIPPQLFVIPYDRIHELE
ncbi:MAG: outer membrane lipoprotein carrier protein LolA [Candidatus Liberibacter ctenarytainae]|uniref:Outer membrane lipoprotein carrier protein LolA n=1 Tax=Candidatus Liberibacter ctenarytainae TaxID=2020335 RepID=A0A937AJS3_9HYPH|nr:outer membrane lipoprotein carrier protein LolA [Candidatus Liberibacter ctenarytainae]